MSKFPRYKLTNKQIRGIARIVMMEQGTTAGRYAEASQIANRTDIRGDEYATPENAVKTVTSGWYAYGKSRYNNGTSDEKVCEIVRRVFCCGLRTLPRYINEHDCMSDIATVVTDGRNVRSDKSKWIKHKTIIRNKMSSTYTFYCFPGGYKTGVDPFGYTDVNMRKKWGDFCYSLKNASTVPTHYTGFLPILPGRGYFQYGDGFIHRKDYIPRIRKCQSYLNWLIDADLVIDGCYGKKTVDAVKQVQSKYGFPVNGCFGKNVLGLAKTVTR